MKKLTQETEIVHGVHSDHVTSFDLVPPIHMTSTFKFKDADHGADLFSGKSTGYIYTRIGNPTVDLLEKKIAVLEGGESAVATASGMAAVAAAALTLTAPGDNFVACSTLYGGTFALFSSDLARLNIHARFVSHRRSGSLKEIEEKIDGDTRFLYIETPANPTLDIIDIPLWADTARRHDIPLIVDNTFASPYLQRPLAMGADLVLHSATKYLGGHGDLIGGLIVGSKRMIGQIRESHMNHFGPVMSPFNAWLILRGLKTLALRMDRHSDTALMIAERLLSHPRVAAVFYPGLASHPGHSLARRQMKKFGGMIAFEVHGGVVAGKAVMNGVTLCTLAVSLGDCETLIQHPASMTHAVYSPSERKLAGISDGLIRLSVGLEHPDDILGDLRQALDRVP
ncbi:PLP-dependent aspartate aminotransferase family protein [Desulfococcus sp.]|uniref:trans-sulfuration enzyme family protein n=1 Tax=Desulfococcus sp. TaxID=2025834 RepID=UPI003593CF80